MTSSTGLEIDAAIEQLAYGWYRDANSCDLSYSGNFSIGEIMAPVLWQGFCSIFRFRDAYINGVGVHFTNSRISNLVAQYFEDSNAVPKTLDYYQPDETTNNQRHTPIVPFAGFMRALQYPLLPVIRKRKTLYVSDHISWKIALSDADGLVLFRRSILKSAFTRLEPNKVADLQSSLPQSLLTSVALDGLARVNRRGNLGFAAEYLEMCARYASVKFLECRPLLVQYGAIWRDFFDFYKPKRCCFPSDSNPLWLMLLMEAKAKGIETRSYLDGYPVVPWLPASRNRCGDDWIVDEVAVYDEAHRLGVVDRGFPHKRTIQVVTSPFGTRSKTECGVNQYEFVVMSYWPYVFSWTADYSSPPETLRTILEVLKSQNAGRIGIKIKHESERGYVQALLVELEMSCEILTGRFSDHLVFAKCVIGGVSTALKESRMSDIPYVLYEPYDNGYTDEWIQRSHFISSSDVIRNTYELSLAVANAT